MLHPRCALALALGLAVQRAVPSAAQVPSPPSCNSRAVALLEHFYSADEAGVLLSGAAYDSASVDTLFTNYNADHHQEFGSDEAMVVSQTTLECVRVRPDSNWLLVSRRVVGRVQVSAALVGPAYQFVPMDTVVTNVTTMVNVNRHWFIASHQWGSYVSPETALKWIETSLSEADRNKLRVLEARYDSPSATK